LSNSSDSETLRLAPKPVPVALRVAAGLCLVVGLLSLFRVLAVSFPLDETSRTWIPFAVNLSAALLMCTAAILALRRSKLALMAVVLAWLIPTANNLLTGGSIQVPSLLMVLALITLATNWQHLK
jgi:hypothetical protein